MADNPSLTADSPEIAPRFAKLDDAVRTLLPPAIKKGDTHAADAIKAANLVTQEMIRIMTADELRPVWRELKKLLNDILRDPPASRVGPQ